MSDKEKPAKDRAAVLAEREAKKLAKKLKATKISDPTKPIEVKPPEITNVEIKKPEETKSNAELKAERRAKQEAQRAAKVAAAKPPPKIVEPPKVIKKSPPPQNLVQHKAQLLFNHLLLERETAKSNSDGIHKAIRKLGTQYQNGIILGSNARCVAMLAAIQEMIEDFKTPAQEEYGRSLDQALAKCSQYLHSCRPISVSMTNALRFLKYQLTLLPNNISDEDAALSLKETIETYVREQIEMAGEAISLAVEAKIENGDVILTYGCSSLIQHILLEAHRNGKTFRVVVVDGRPFTEGKEMLRRLVAAVNKVLLGAHALLANGYVMSRIGTAQISLMAKAHNVSVLVCCETYKFCERVQTDSFVFNEIAESDKLVIKCDEKELPPSVIPLNLTYDVTPPDLVSAVVTELAILPCTSVPVILRIKPTDTCY